MTCCQTMTRRIVVLFLFMATIAYSQDTTTANNYVVANNYGNWNIQLHSKDGDMVSVAAWTKADTGELLVVRVMNGELDTYVVWTRTITKLRTTKIATDLDDFSSLDTWAVEQDNATFPPESQSFLKLLLNGNSLTLTVQAADKKTYRAIFKISGLFDAMSNSQEIKDYFEGTVGR